MGKEDFRVFKTFSDKHLVSEFTALLEDGGIPFQVLDNSPAIDITFSGNTLENEVQVLIKESDFREANRLLELQAEQQLAHVDSNHYLFAFTTEELFEVLVKPEEWSVLDLKLAQQILNDRGEKIDDGLLEKMKQKRIRDLAQPEPKQTGWIFFGYAFAILGGLLAVMVGWYLSTYKKTLPDGRKIYAYQEEDRMHGKRIFYIGFFFFFAWAIASILLRR